jgi:hypothetical protein
MKITISDISMAAFFLIKGLRMLSAKKSGNKFEFVFEDPTGISDSLENEYILSDFSRYDAAVRKLKNRVNSEK